MGEIAEAMLDGTLCAGCGVSLDMEPAGYPVYCSACEPSDYGGPVLMDTLRSSPKQRCPICGARKLNVVEHAKAKHPRRWRELSVQGELKL